MCKNTITLSRIVTRRAKPDSKALPQLRNALHLSGMPCAELSYCALKTCKTWSANKSCHFHD